jgi:flagellar protein FlbT
MPLKIELKPGERAIINGAVVEGAATQRTEFVLLNRAVVMRERHIMKEEEANTPVKRLYFTLQMLYIEPQQKEHYYSLFEEYFKDLKQISGLPAVQIALDQIKVTAEAGEFYEALKICRVMIETEEKLMELGRAIQLKGDDKARA